MALVTDILTVITATAAIVLVLLTSLLYIPFRWRPVRRFRGRRRAAAAAAHDGRGAL
jgi:hypothetical protein